MRASAGRHASTYVVLYGQRGFEVEPQTDPNRRTDCYRIATAAITPFTEHSPALSYFASSRCEALARALGGAALLSESVVGRVVSNESEGLVQSALLRRPGEPSRRCIGHVTSTCATGRIPHRHVETVNALLATS